MKFCSSHFCRHRFFSITNFIFSFVSFFLLAFFFFSKFYYFWLNAVRYYKWARIFISPPVDDSVVVHPVMVTIVTKSLPMVDVAILVADPSSILATTDSELVAFSISADLAFDSFVIVSWLPLLLLVAFKNNASMSCMSVLDLECFASMIEFDVLLVVVSLLRGWLLPFPLLLLLPPIIAGIRKRLFRVRL